MIGESPPGMICSYQNPARGRMIATCLTCESGPGSPCFLPDGWKSVALELMLVIRRNASAGPVEEVLAMYDRAERVKDGRLGTA